MAKSRRKTRNKPVGKKVGPDPKPIGWGIDQGKYDAARRKK